MTSFQVAIDGPAGSGKSSISKILSKKLNFNHVDTGAMYRAVTYEALNRGIDLNDNESYQFLNEIDIEYKDNSIYLNGLNINDEIRSHIVAQNVSVVAKQKLVRDKMVEIQRNVANKGNVIMDGRDIGYIVLPNANLKIFLNADVTERAKRRHKENLTNGINIEISKLIEEIKERDRLDSTRKLNPLRKAKDAIEIDTTSLTMEEVIDEIIGLIKERGVTNGI
ncbi:(d)CMP kinase [Mycoplasmatota bacterium WC44]